MAVDVDVTTVLLSIISEGIGIHASYRELADRLRRGEPVTMADVEAAHGRAREAVARWEAAGAHDRPE